MTDYIPEYNQLQHSSPSCYIRGVLSNHSLRDLLSQEVLDCRKSLVERGRELGLPGRSTQLNQFFQELSDKNPWKIEYLKWYNDSREARLRLKGYQSNSSRKPQDVSRQAHIQKAKNLDKYGVSDLSDLSPLQKYRLCCLRRYGVEHPAQSLVFQEKSRQTNIRKYGVIAATQLPVTQEKIRKTSLQRFGVSHHSKLQDYRDKLSRYNDFYWESRLGSNYRDWKITLGSGFLSLDKSLATRATELGVPASSLTQFYQRISPEFSEFITSDEYKARFYRHSTLERDLLNYFRNQGFSVESAHRLPSKKEIDLYFPDYAIGFELNGYLFHCGLNKETSYHKDKTTEALSQGIKLYHLWYETSEDEGVFERFRLFINSHLGISQVSVSAGSLKCRPVSYQEAFCFHWDYHFHKSPKLSKNDVSYGLYHQGLLVSCVTWRKSHTQANNIRYTIKSGYCIKFGFQKLLSHSLSALSLLGAQSLITYCDRDLSPDPDSTVYSRAGFQLVNRNCFPLQLSYYVYPRSLMGISRGHHPRQDFMKHKLPVIFPDLYDSALTAHEILDKAQIYPVWNSGCWKFVKSLK